MLLLPRLKKHHHGTVATAVQPPAPALNARRYGRRRRGEVHDVVRHPLRRHRLPVHVRQPPAAVAAAASASGVLPSATACVLPSAAGGLPSAACVLPSAAGGQPCAAGAAGGQPTAGGAAGGQPTASVRADAGVQPNAVGVVHAAEHAIVPHPAGDALPARPWVQAERRGGLRRGVARGDLHGGVGGRSIGIVIVRRWVGTRMYGRELHRSMESHGN